MYLYSTGAQVIAGLFGLTLAGYIFFNDRLEKEVLADDSLYDVVETLKKGYYRSIIKMGVVCVFAVALCMLNIALNSFLQTYEGMHIFLLNQTVLFILIEILYIVDFVIKVADPNKILKLSNARKSEIEGNDEDAGDLSEFLKYYNNMQDLIISTADYLINKQSLQFTQKNHKEYKPPILQSLNILQSKEILTKSLINKINEIRKYRNYTVHSSEPMVTISKCQQAKQLYEEIKDQIDNYFDMLNKQIDES
ncbi:hypothetical protein [Paenibacillus sp. HW567]|uniref:hypothetical protein n=1 Tax=Paenibacillus sp. HW567 TaxID=1034769 RepID=UPI0018DEACA1|nr:hypothetical protein [Paenibacillus sp. HW567]